MLLEGVVEQHSDPLSLPQRVLVLLYFYEKGKLLLRKGAGFLVRAMVQFLKVVYQDEAHKFAQAENYPGLTMRAFRKIGRIYALLRRSVPREIAHDYATLRLRTVLVDFQIACQITDGSAEGAEKFLVNLYKNNHWAGDAMRIIYFDYKVRKSTQLLRVHKIEDLLSVTKKLNYEYAQQQQQPWQRQRETQPRACDFARLICNLLSTLRLERKQYVLVGESAYRHTPPKRDLLIIQSEQKGFNPCDKYFANSVHSALKMFPAHRLPLIAHINRAELSFSERHQRLGSDNKRLRRIPLFVQHYRYFTNS